MADLRNDEALVAGLHRQQPAGKLLVCGWWLAGPRHRATMMREAAAVESCCCGPVLVLVLVLVLVQTSLGTFQSRTWAPVTASYHAGLSPLTIIIYYNIM